MTVNQKHTFAVSLISLIDVIDAICILARAEVVRTEMPAKALSRILSI